MQAIFAAHGPSFRRSAQRIPPFRNLEVHGLVNELLGIPARHRPPTEVSHSSLSALQR
jgi:hypothetical protein